MNTDSWISRIEKKRKLKKKAKLREKFDFLIRELNESEKRVIVQVISEESVIISSKSEELENSMKQAIGKQRCC